MPTLDLMAGKPLKSFFNCLIGAGDVQLDSKNFYFFMPTLDLMAGKPLKTIFLLQETCSWSHVTGQVVVLQVSILMEYLTKVCF
jgi:hypothetical protein